MLHWGVPMKRAARIEWARQDEKLAKAKDKFKDDPEKQETEVAKLLESFKRPKFTKLFILPALPNFDVPNSQNFSYFPHCQTSNAP